MNAADLTDDEITVVIQAFGQQKLMAACNQMIAGHRNSLDLVDGYKALRSLLNALISTIERKEL